MSSASAHFLFANTASAAVASLDFRDCGEKRCPQRDPNGLRYLDCYDGGHSLLAIHSYGCNDEEWIANNIGPSIQEGGNRTYFFWDQHGVGGF
ncbi:MAG: hypothetical protein QXK37_01190 [Candidatus Woesearchaeota archaeon]